MATHPHDTVTNATTQSIFEVLLRISKAMESIDGRLGSVIAKRQHAEGGKTMDWNVLMVEPRSLTHEPSIGRQIELLRSALADVIKNLPKTK